MLVQATKFLVFIGCKNALLALYYNSVLADSANCFLIKRSKHAEHNLCLWLLQEFLDRIIPELVKNKKNMQPYNYIGGILTIQTNWPLICPHMHVHYYCAVHIHACMQTEKLCSHSLDQHWVCNLILTRITELGSMVMPFERSGSEVNYKTITFQPSDCQGSKLFSLISIKHDIINKLSYTEVETRNVTITQPSPISWMRNADCFKPIILA